MILLCSNGSFALTHIAKALGKLPSEISLLYVTTAGKVMDDHTYLEAHKKAMAERGYTFRDYDIDGKTESDIDAALHDRDAVYVEGGNTFYLLKAIRESGFDHAVKRFLDRGKLYAGSSAGAHVACPSIAMSTWKIPGDEKPRYGVDDLTGMSLVPFLVVCHYTAEKEPQTRAGIASTNLSVRILQDGQGLLVRDRNAVFLGEGEEIRL